MKTLELRALLNDQEKEIEIPIELIKVFNIWKEKRKDSVLDPIEIFYAGYILSNPVVREQYRKSKEINIKY